MGGALAANVVETGAKPKLVIFVHIFDHIEEHLPSMIFQYILQKYFPMYTDLFCSSQLTLLALNDNIKSDCAIVQSSCSLPMP